MLDSVPVDQQYASASGDDLRILIVGAGIAGVTAAQLLRKAGRNPVLIERNVDGTHPGYMLALMPMVDGVFDDLLIRTAYRLHSVAFDSYGLHSHRGRMIRVDPIAGILDRYGDYRGIARGELLEVLATGGCPVAFGTTVGAIGEAAGAIDESGAPVRVALESGGRACDFLFDLIIVADGLHSSTRERVPGGREAGVVDTGWGGWVVWAPEDDKMNLGEELWGAGFFYGVYPVKRRLGVFLGGPLEDTRPGPRQFVVAVREKLTDIDPRMESCLNAVATADDPFFWPLNDCRSPQWAFGRTILLGDAAAGFLPTAGIGAGMAMESAWVLARMLRHANSGNIETLLHAYEAAQRPRVETAQQASRSLARIMFRQSRLLAVLRELAMRFVSVEAALKPIQKLLADKPDPDRIAREALRSTAGADAP
jgi:2-polyprenyl-6-methoxyphenol hydroxylase-like FAD-dependent oxidoreductase